MKISVPTNHNFYEECALNEVQLKEQFGTRKVSDFKKLKEQLFSSTYTFSNKNRSLKKLQIFGFKNNRNRLQDEEELILKLYSKENDSFSKEFIIQTGLFAGVVYHKGYQFNIVTPFGDTFLKRMLNFVNDIYIDNKLTNANKTQDINEFQNIIAYLFIQSLEKAAVLGLPKVYQTTKERSNKVRGKVDINSYIRQDIPFTGKLTSIYREQKYVQEIIDVLYVACLTLEKKFGKDIHQKILGVFQLLKQHYSGVFPQSLIIKKAINHSVLQNPVFRSFRKVLEYAEIILKEQNLLMSNIENKLTTTGYLFDISQLFEVYLEKLLSRYFKDWYVSGQEEIQVYEGLFFKRKMLPDILLKHKYSNKIIVFDAKFKTMRLQKRDLDRSDFYQIHSYAQYYAPNNIIAGLIYPLRKQLNIDKSHAANIFNNPFHKSKFIVDGIYVNREMSLEDIRDSENKFLFRIEKTINEVLSLSDNLIDH
ncbi:5-methylcytosine-specific restriction endonuclease McrBC regulatory subunit McrC [Nonlabens xylanidelens]|uniref:5-methylcytosine-specific restriction endonuclease McrBC regulatory subunit McrC n=1 Tax=Nonlabens xylanidelens TaxID=191564 RepID=A0A2S6IEZ6_9FLAO|nr:hypothetical protein [Nonlabens xylanidelens]PPK92779.1 5-methylcytosine-specific restriction endonuclease McrBC regulatory subunit McrC [Nonlabens xylanidelens]PQJ19824.1 hypothetical protein BST94_06160 [Nonlabens xylanidelens]